MNTLPTHRRRPEPALGALRAFSSFPPTRGIRESSTSGRNGSRTAASAGAFDAATFWRHEWKDWSVLVQSEVGHVRTRQEDAWCALPDARFQGSRIAAFGVFDGLGGMPNGQRASRAAAAGLEEALNDSKTYEEILSNLNPHVRRTGGATTAVLAFVSPPDQASQVTLVSVGDSAAYRLDAHGRPTLLTPRDRAARNVLTEYLGAPHVSGHVTTCPIPRDGSLLLCTDGVDGFVPASTIRTALAADEPAMAFAVNELFEEIHEQGAPDNATVMLARCRSVVSRESA